MQEINNSDTEKIQYIEEENYAETMKQVVTPLLSANKKSGYFEGYEGIRLYYEYYLNPREKAAIVISHGFCEFTSKFEEVVYYMFCAGYSVFLFDQRGHGYSDRKVEDSCKVHINSYEEYIQDLDCFIKKIVEKNKLQKKMVLYGHSMGGAIAALFLEQFPKTFQGCVLASPMLQIECGKTPESLVYLLMWFKKLTHAETEYVSGHKGFDGIPHFETSNCLSLARYQYIFSKRQKDEHYRTYGGSCGWTLASIKAVRKLQKHAKEVTVPTLIFQAEWDTSVRAGGQVRFAAKSQNTKIEMIKNTKHEIYNAQTKTVEEYFQKLFRFLDTI